MGYRELITETEAASLAGISPRTLRRFIDSGYLAIEHDADGLPLFERQEVAKLFGVRVDKVAANSGARPSLASSDTSEKIIDLKLASTLSLKPSRTAHDSIPAQVEAPVNSASFTSNALVELESEVDKLTHVLDVQEKLLEEREREVHQLMSERDWLRKRIERLEEKGERDQILLLSETQALRKLIHLQAEKKGFVRLMLDWLGVTAPVSTYPVIQQQMPSPQVHMQPSGDQSA